MTGEKPDRLVDQVGGQVVAVLEPAGRVDRRIVAHQLGRILVGLGVEKSVKPVEPAAQGPTVKRPARAGFDRRRHMPFAEHVVPVAVGPQHFGERRGLPCDLAAIAGKAAIEIRQAPDADRMVVAPGEERCSRRRAYCGRVKPGVAQPLSREPVDRRGADRRAVAAEIGKPNIVKQHDQDVRRPLRRRCRPGPPRRRFDDRLANSPREPRRTGAFRFSLHALPPRLANGRCS